MKQVELLRRRLHAHLLTGPKPPTAGAVVDHCGALQAQDRGQLRWALGARTSSPLRSAIEDEIARGDLVRTWPMRGTLHVVRPGDVGWMLDLLAGRAMARAAPRQRQLGLTTADLDRGHTIVDAQLRTGPKTRPELFAALAAGGVPPEGQRGIHLLLHLAHHGHLVVGPTIGRQPTYRLLHEPQVVRPRDEALHEIAMRYVRSHGPATRHDLAFWTGLTVADCGRALDGTDAARDGDLHYLDVDPPPMPRGMLLLAGFDEYVLGYRDRSPVLDDGAMAAIVPGGNGVFRPTVVARGRAIGTWSPTGPASACAFDGRAIGTWSPTGPASACAFDSRPIDVDARAYERFRAG